MKKALEEKLFDELDKERNITDLHLKADLSIAQALYNWRVRKAQAKEKARELLEEFYERNEIAKTTWKNYQIQIKKLIEVYCDNYIKELVERKKS